MSRCRRRADVGGRQHQPKAAPAKTPPSDAAERLCARPPALRLLDAYAGASDLRTPVLAQAQRRQPVRVSFTAQGREHHAGARDRSRGEKRAGMPGSGNRIAGHTRLFIRIHRPASRVGLLQEPAQSDRSRDRVDHDGRRIRTPSQSEFNAVPQEGEAHPRFFLRTTSGYERE